MNDRTEELLERLFKEARAGKPDTEAQEFGFETRLMAALQERRAAAAPWYALAWPLVWRMLPTFAVIAIVLAVCSMSLSKPDSNDLFAALNVGQDELVASSYLTGE